MAMGARVPRLALLAPLGLAGIALLALSAQACSRDVVDALVIGSCRADPTAAGCPRLVWPNDASRTNSDPWLVQHHDELIRIEPRVLVLDFYNGLPGSADAPVFTVADVQKVAVQQAAALALGSRFHGYADAAAPAFVQYKIVRTVDLTDTGGPPAGWRSPSSTLVPLTPGGSFDPTALFTQAFADRFQFPDPAEAGRNLTLCELFQQGVINEAWVAIGEGPPRGFNVLERKQVYDAALGPVAGKFEPAAGGAGNLNGVECGVTVRIAHLNPLRGLGCDLDIRAWPLEAEATLGPVPYLATNGISFFNGDFMARFGAPFNSWDDVCSGSSSASPCMTYDTPTRVVGMHGNATWIIDPFLQGCGTAVFPPNARYPDDDFDATPAQSRCEHYAMADGNGDGGAATGGGADLPDIYTSDKTLGPAADLDALTAGLDLPAALPGSADCGGGWQVYLRQNIPGLANRARDTGGLPMKNWWPFLFY